MEKLRLRANKPRRALASTQVASDTASDSRLCSILKRGATVVIVSGMAVAGFSTFTATSTTATGVAFADQGLAISSIPAVQAASATSTRSLSAEELAAARSNQLDQNDAAVSEQINTAAAAARSAALGSATKKFSAEADRLKNLSKFLWPTDGDVSSPYGMRKHPILRYSRMHDGDDIGGKCGQPIWAAQSGTVTKATTSGYNGGSGHNVWIDHGDINGNEVSSGYLHMDKISVDVGEKVTKGQVIGTVGNTGLSTACHLHFSVRRDGASTNPMVYIGWNLEGKKE